MAARLAKCSGILWNIVALSFLVALNNKLFASNALSGGHNTKVHMDIVKKKENDPTVSVYVYDAGERIALDEFLKKNKELKTAKSKNSPVIGSSCRNFAWQVKKDNISGLHIEEVADDIADHFRKICNIELGVTKIQSIYDQLSFTAAKVNYKEKVELMARKMKKKIGNYLESLDKNKRKVEELYSHHLWSQPILDLSPCSKVKKKFLKYNENFGIKVNIEKSCDMIVPQHSYMNYGFSPGRNLTSIFSFNLKQYPSMKWQYFITSKGLHTEYPSYLLPENSACVDSVCLNIDYLRHNDMFSSTVQQRSKFIVILIDRSNSMSKTQLKLAKKISIGLLSALTERDKVAVLSVDTHVTVLGQSSDECSHILEPAADVLKNRLVSPIQGMEKAENSLGANHTLGLENSFEILSRSIKHYKVLLPSKNILPIIIYVSRGLSWYTSEIKSLLQLISLRNLKLNNTVVINSCIVVDNLRPDVNEKQFLKLIAEQSSVNKSATQKSEDFQGKVVEFSFYSNFRRSINSLLAASRQADSADSFFSLPRWDNIGNGFVVGLSKPCFHMRNVIGMVGIDVHLDDIAEDVIFYSSLLPVKSHSFIMHKTGYVVAHSLLSKGHSSNVHSSLVLNLSTFYKNVVNFEALKSQIKRNYSGQKRTKLEIHKHSYNATKDPHEKFTHAQFTWRRVDGTPYIVCIVAFENINFKKSNKKLNINKISCNDHVRYHRLDLNPPRKEKNGGFCRHDNQLVSMDTSTVFLSPSAFQHPFRYLNQPDTKEKVQTYLGYLCDSTNLIPNPGVRSGIRNDVSGVIHITDYWRDQVSVSHLNNYIVRRYVGLPSGVILTYPGMVMKKNYGVTKQKWYLDAIRHVGKVVIGAPNSDEGGIGKISLSHTIYEGKHAALHSTLDRIVAVMGMDVTMGYVYQLLTSTVPLCNEPNIRCFIFNDEGYMIAHPNLLRLGDDDSSIWNHITKNEPLIANDILCHEGFVEKKSCIDLQKNIIRRSYHFNANWQGVLRNLVHGEHCARYEIQVIHGTNAFLGVINQTCNVAIAFCSCSTMDRLCMICKRMEQTACECPCECPMQVGNCEDNLTTDLEMCEQSSDDLMSIAMNRSLISGLRSCFHIDCYSLKTHHDCLGIIGCAWCEQNTDKTPLKRPFCSEQLKCYNGILENEASYMGDVYTTEKMPKARPSGAAVAGGIMGFFLFFIIIVYCARKFKHRVDPSCQSNVSTFVLPPSDNNFKMLAFDNDPDEYIDEPIHAITPQGMLLAEFKNVSPYRMNSTYRRPTGGNESSDHGYSTMTPHDDSVHNGVPYNEQLVPIARCLNSDTTQSVTSFNSEASAPPGEITSQTVVPSDIDPKHGVKFLARAQVHMVQ